MSVERDYASAEYWEARYEKDRGLFDWYFDWNELFEKHLSEVGIQPPVLVVGCGNSDLSMRLEKMGVSPVISTDISKVCCRNMVEQHGGCYLPMDVCNLQFRDDSFPCVIDKGTMDALLCGRHYEVQVTKMMQEIGRVLAVHGIFVEITFGKNGERMGVFDCPELLPWTLESTIHVESQGETVYICIFRKFQECVIQDVEKCIYLYGEDEESEEESD